MWRLVPESEADSRTHRYSLQHQQETMTFVDVIAQWQSNREFRTFFNASLAESDISAFRWETPPVTTTTVQRPFEFVLLDAPGLDRRVDELAFRDHFTTDASVVRFANLRGDAELIVPCPAGPVEHYGHLASFVRSAPPEQCDELWRTVGEAVKSRLSDMPLWLSTAGMGVAWLHIRIDSGPKYYGYTPYRSLS